MATVAISQLTKHYEGADRPSLDALNLDIADGEFLVLVGPSGCGKSTALKLIGGLEDVTAGEIRIGGQVVNDYASRDRDIAMVFQSYALYPHMTVFDNIAFPLQIAKVPKDEIARRVDEVAGILQLKPMLGRKPGRLSGGQRQRVAMGRAIIRRPSVFLMDEPLSNLDAKLRVKMRSEVAQIQRTLGVTTIYVTHDQVEAMTMGDRVALMRHGVLQQVDAPDVMYHSPANTFVASFIGSPAMNLFQGRLVRSEEALFVELGDQRIEVPRAAQQKYSGLDTQPDGEIIIGLRPEDLEDARLRPDHPPAQIIEAEVQLVESLGSDQMAHVIVDAPQIHDDEEAVPEDFIPVAGSGHGICICRFSSQSPVRRGERTRIAVAAERLHFFDPQTREALRTGA